MGAFSTLLHLGKKNTLRVTPGQFYPSQIFFTLALLVLLVTNIMSVCHHFQPNIIILTMMMMIVKVLNDGDDDDSYDDQMTCNVV